MLTKQIMNVDQTDKPHTPWLLRKQTDTERTTLRDSSKKRSRHRQIGRAMRRHSFRLFTLTLALLLMGRNSYTPTEMARQAIHKTVDGWEFDLLRWEIDSSRSKATLLVDDPTMSMSVDESSQLVRTYINRTGTIADLTNEQTKWAADGDAEEANKVQKEINALYALQQKERLFVESIIQQQIGSELAQEGITVLGKPFPPVLFSFTNPPKKMVVSPRDRVEVIHAEMIAAEIDLESIEQSERTVLDEQDLSMYITNIGGLGAFPTLVIETKNLEWILSTVAHEWTHNYLTLYPLGINYATSAELTIINETVAEIVGNEIGERAFARYYTDLADERSKEEETAVETETASEDEQESVSTDDEADKIEEKRFDFRMEMRETRLAVDDYLTKGQIQEAEYYMELRRMDFVENGYPLRVLNQAYFAFHGSYGTSAASSSMIGPALAELRDQQPDLATFLREVRWFTSEEDITSLDNAD